MQPSQNAFVVKHLCLLAKLECWVCSSHSARFDVVIELSLIMWQTPQEETPKYAVLFAGSKDRSLDDAQRTSAPTVAPMLL